MKKIPKSLLDRYTELSQQYWDTGNVSILDDMKVASFELQDAINVDWLSVENFIDAIIRNGGFFPHAENEKIYEVLSVLGWEVTDNVEMEHPAR
jgi:hypothetical protein